MKGYYKPYVMPDLTPVSTEVLVGCKRCRGTWYETQMLLRSVPRINSCSYQYDYCDSCISAFDPKPPTPKEEE